MVFRVATPERKLLRNKELGLSTVPEKILFVDDEPAVLDGYTRLLYREFEIRKAVGATEGLATIERDGPFAVVVSDMRMPGMNGAQFLAEVRRRHPNTVRMLLTGYSDIDAAMQAVNEGNISKFLSKPCEKSVLVEAVNSGLSQYRTVTEEKELVRKALEGGTVEPDPQPSKVEEPTGLPASSHASAQFNSFRKNKTPFYIVLFKIGGINRIDLRYGQHVADDYMRQTAHHLIKKLKPLDLLYQHERDTIIALLPRSLPPFSVRAELLAIAFENGEFVLGENDWSTMIRRDIKFRSLPGTKAATLDQAIEMLEGMPNEG